MTCDCGATMVPVRWTDEATAEEGWRCAACGRRTRAASRPRWPVRDAPPVGVFRAALDGPGVALAPSARVQETT